MSTNNLSVRKRRWAAWLALGTVCALIVAVKLFIDWPAWYRVVSVVAYSADGAWLAAGTRAVSDRHGTGPRLPNMVVLIDRKTGSVARTLPLDDRYAGAMSLAFSPDGGTLAVGTRKFTVLWDLRTGNSRPLDTDGKTLGLFAAFRPDGRTLIQEAGRGIALVDIQNGKIRRAIAYDGRAMAFHGRPALSRDGSTLAIAHQGYVYVLRVPSGRLVRRLVEQNRDIRGLAVSPDGAFVATTGWPNDALHLWNMRTGVMTDTRAAADVMAFSPDGKWLATNDGLRLRDTATGRLSRTFPVYDVRAIDFSPDGKVIAIGRGDEVDQWDVSTGQRLSTLKIPEVERK